MHASFRASLRRPTPKQTIIGKSDGFGSRKVLTIVAQQTKEGRSSPLGATLSPQGANFSVYSKHATGIGLLFFDRVDDARPARVIRIDPSTNRTYHYWHVFVPSVQPGQIYGYRVHGPADSANGMRFDPAKILLDPSGRGVVAPRTIVARLRVRKAITPRCHEKRSRGSVRVQLGR